MNARKHQLNKGHQITVQFLSMWMLGIICLYWLLIAYRLPLNVSPDELLRYKLPLFLYHNGYFPSGYDPRVMLPYGNYSYAFYPQWLGPLLSSFWMKIMSFFSTQPRMLLFAARWTSIFFGAVTIFFVGLSAEKLYHRRWLTLLATILVSFLPQFVYLSVYVNNDVIAIAGVSIIVYALVSATVERWNYRSAIMFAIGSTCSLLGYLNAVAFVVIGGAYAVTSLIIQVKAGKIAPLKAWKYVTFSLIIVIGICAPFFIRNYIVYHDILGNHIFATRYHSWIRHGGAPTMVPFQGSWMQLLFHSQWFELTIKSTIGLFGYMTIEMKQPFYYCYYVLFSIGLILSIFSVWRESKLVKCFYFMMTMAIIVTIGLSLYRSKTLDFQAQGRYIMTSIPVLSLLLVAGYRQLPMIIQKWAVYVLTMGYALIGAIVTYHYIMLRLC